MDVPPAAVSPAPAHPASSDGAMSLQHNNTMRVHDNNRVFVLQFLYFWYYNKCIHFREIERIKRDESHKNTRLCSYVLQNTMQGSVHLLVPEPYQETLLKLIIRNIGEKCDQRSWAAGPQVRVWRNCRLYFTNNLLAAGGGWLQFREAVAGRKRERSGTGPRQHHQPDASPLLTATSCCSHQETTSDRGVAMGAFFWSNAQCVFVTIFRWREEQELCHEHELFQVTSAVKNASDVLVQFINNNLLYIINNKITLPIPHSRTVGGRNVPPIWLLWSAKVDTSPDIWRWWRW